MQRILIADDNDENLYYLQALLTAGGYEVAAAKNGAEALETARAHPPALMVADILMPVMDGFALCQRWRNDPRLAGIPFVFYTATYTDPKDRELGLNLGADEFLVKPVEPDAFLEIVGKVLRRQQAGAPPDRSSAASEDDGLLKQYNAALIRKLEDKLVQLEAANRKLADAEAFVRAVLDNSPLAIVAADVEGRILLTNPAFTATFGYLEAEATGRLCSDLIDPPGFDSELELLAQRMAGDRRDLQCSQRRRKDGALIEVEICLGPMMLNGRVSGLFAIYRDITEQRKLEEQLRQSQKLEAVGQLAAGVAHDFNNLLGIVVGYSELIRAAAEPQSRLQRQADQIRQACERASALTRQLLAFSRRQVLLPQVIELESFVEETLKMVRRLIREDIELAVHITKPVGQILADPAQFEQVVLNLVTNARDAMPHGGRLSLDLCNLDVHETEARRPPLRPGEYVRLSVTDTGEGMDEATMARIFEPFFTTKPPGYGTGLGLASVHGIVEQSGGVILVSSQPGKGACFEVYFPRVNAAAVHESLPESAPPLGSETILVAEDEEALRELICEMLNGLGYRVLPAGSAGDAVRMVRDLQEHIDLLVTDLIMPSMSGRELSELAWSLRPHLRVLYVSGYDPNQIRTQPSRAHRTEFLAKPFSRERLAAVVRRLLDGEDLASSHASP
jgi:PAS domain S-box-containing protein